MAASSTSAAHGVDASDTRLPFDDRAFDTVVATLALCFAPDLAGAAAEVARVLRPGGRLLFLEHVRSPSPRLARWQDRLAAPWLAVAVGCHCNYDLLGCLAASPLVVEWFERGTLRRFPALVRPLVLGAAVAPTR